MSNEAHKAPATSAQLASALCVFRKYWAPAALMAGIGYFATAAAGGQVWQAWLAGIGAFIVTQWTLASRTNVEAGPVAKVMAANERQRRQRSTAIALMLGLMVVLFYATTLVRFGGAIAPKPAPGQAAPTQAAPPQGVPK